ncbi:MAG: hypothetical protein DRJ30_00645 [Candidatus Methanomethylicota archaeon]|nr:MAG: hypothetical protein DRJ30_00645 [Candidatus Verstraetearchaeota archaeon]
MIIVEKLLKNDVSKLLHLSSSFQSKSYLSCEGSLSSGVSSIGLVLKDFEEENFFNYTLESDDIEEISSRINVEGSIQFVAKDLQNILGFIDLVLHGDIAEIKCFLVKNISGRIQIYKVLLKRALTYCKLKGVNKIKINVSNRNYTLINLYERLGFHVTGIFGTDYERLVNEDFYLELSMKL